MARIVNPYGRLVPRHQVMRDAPDVVTDAILRMIARIRN